MTMESFRFDEKYLSQIPALQVLVNDSFRYVNEWHGPSSAVLEFETVCEGIQINGAPLHLHFGGAGGGIHAHGHHAGQALEDVGGAVGAAPAGDAGGGEAEGFSGCGVHRRWVLGDAKVRPPGREHVTR